VTFGNANAVDTTATFSTSGTYVLRLTASDSALQAYDEVTITVNPASSAKPIPGRVEGEDYNPGGEGVGYHDTTVGNQGDATQYTDDVDVDVCIEGGFNIGRTAAGEWLAFAVNVAQTGNYDMTVRVATTYTDNRYLTVKIDGGDVATFICNNTGGWDIYANVTVTGVPLTAGSHELRIQWSLNGIDLNYLDVALQSDTTAPTPNPLTWATVPYATGSTTISMTATTASDPSGVEYLFDCTAGAGGHDSGWQDSTTYQDTGLTPSTQYTYWVQARDKSANQNAGGWSTSQSATTDAAPDTTPPTPNPSTWATVPYATGSTSISMTATTASDPSGVQYFFGCTAGAGGHDSGWQSSATYQDTGLTPSTQYSYRVQTRDQSANQNTGSWSTTQSATTQAGGGGLPSPWASGDIGAVGAAGSAAYASGTFTVDGSGADIHGNLDEFHYVYQSLSGDGQIVAYIASLEVTNAWAKCGVMIRESLNANSANAMMAITGSNGARFQYRLTTDGSTSNSTTAGYTAPYWVKVVRSGNTFSGFRSANGVDWVQQGSNQTINMATNVYIGLAVCSHSDGVLCTTEFSNVTVSGSVVTLLQDGFETNFDKWTDGGTTDWDRATDQKHAGTYAAHAGSSDNDLFSDNVNTTGRSSITIDFWYRDDDIDDDDNAFLQVYNGSAYADRLELGNSTEDTWQHAVVTINNSGGDAAYFISTFRIKFEGTSLDSGENLWIDDVLVTAQ
jgi:hypothetical protein